WLLPSSALCLTGSQGKRLSWRYAACKTIKEEPARSEVIKAIMRAVRAVREGQAAKGGQQP
ncbi:MAG: hypothetical protein L7H09_02700, partial [Acidilobus sp.]|nr:hypothetical protein [Acidilobus sp.]